MVSMATKKLHMYQICIENILYTELIQKSDPALIQYQYTALEVQFIDDGIFH